MCWYCCISLRGAVYFGTSVHIFVGLVLLVRWILVTYIATIVTGNLLTDVSLLILTVLFGVYLVIFITLGCIIFAGTERQSITVLKWSATGFTILQVLLFTVMLILYLFAPDGWTFLPFLEPDSDVTRILTIAMYFCCLIATLNYILVLLMYTRKLWNVKKSSLSGGGRGGRSNSLTNIQISHPIPHHQTAVVPSSSGGSSSIQKQHGSVTNSSTLTSTPSYYHGQPHNQVSGYGFQRGNVRRSTPMSHHHGPESPGIYESLDTSSVSGHQHFYPANYYTGYTGNRLTPTQEGIYNGSIRSSAGSGMYYHQRPYPYPHQRYREPIIPSTTNTAAIANSSTSQIEEDDAETPGQDWMGAYGHRLQVFQRGQQERNSTTMEPLLQRQQQQQQQLSTNY